MKKDKYVSIKFVVLLIFSAAVAVSLILVNLLALRQAEKILGLSALDFLRACAANMDLDALKKVMDTMDDSINEYKALNSYLRKAREKSSFKYLYTIKIEKNKLTYLVDGLDPSSEGFSALGEEEESFLDQYNLGNEFYTSVYSDPKWGRLQTAAIPIKQEGKIIAWLAGDFDASVVSNVQRSFFFLFLVFSGFLFMIIISVIMYIFKNLNTLDKTFSIIANGDLSKEIAIKGNNEIAHIFASAEKTRQGLKNLIQSIKVAAADVLSKSEEINNFSNYIAKDVKDLEITNQGLYQFIESLHASIEELSASSEQFNASLATLTSEVESISKSTVQVTSATETGKKSLQGAVSSSSFVIDSIRNFEISVKSLQEKTNNIQSVLSEISTIAEQTNLLALNAAIEAARAGEVGRGFAVVADEIRKLAEQSKEATKRISNILLEITNAVGLVSKNSEDGIKKVEELNINIKQASEKYKEIDELVNKVMERISNLLALSEEEKAIFSQFVSTVESVVSSSGLLVNMAKNIEKMVEQTSKNSESISKQSESLKVAVDVLDEKQKIFKL